MKPSTTILPRLTATVLALLMLAASWSACAQALKGANWLRADENYSTLPMNDPRRVAWNLEIAKDVPEILRGQPAANFTHLYEQHGIRTLMRLAFDIKPTAWDKAVLESNNFSCTDISQLMGRVDEEVARIPSSEAIGAFILANEPNLISEWNISGSGYGRFYRCYRERWATHPYHAHRPLLASGPGGCGAALSECQTFFSTMLAAMGTSVDGFAIHAYGRSGSAFAAEMGWQLNAINQAGNTAAREKPVYITEYNSGASENTPLPEQPRLPYFNAIIDAARNANGPGQIKALLYFVDSPDSWQRGGHNCMPVRLPTGPWALSSLCNDTISRMDWLQARGNPTWLDAGIELARLPAFMMPGQILRFDINVRNTGTATWDGTAASSWFRLGAHSGNGFMFSHVMRCGGYAHNTADARAYTCADVAPETVHQYRVLVRAPAVANNATFSVRMVRDGTAWFGTSAQQNVMIGQTRCGSPLTQCILRMRPDVLPFYQANGWDISCPRRNEIVADWCGNVDSDGSCARLKADPCAAFDTPVRCPAFTQLGGVTIPRQDSFQGYRACGPDQRVYACGADGVWTASTTPCK